MAKLHKKSILKKTAAVSILLLLSKFLGVAREILQVRYLGVGPLSDAFNSVMKIPNLLRKVFADGAMNAAFIPTVVQVMKNESETQASRLTTLMSIFFGIVIGLLCIIVSVFPEPFILLSAPGFREKPVEFASAVSLMRIVIYFVFFVFWSALLAGALQAKMHFTIPSWGPALLNIFYIGGLMACLQFGLPIEVFAYFLLAGGLAQALLYLFVYFKLHFTIALPNKTTWKYFKEVMIKFIPCLLSTSVIEVNLFIDNRFASTLPTGSITLLTVSSRFMSIALGAFAVAFSSILLSHFSRISSYAPSRLSFYLHESTKLILWVTVPFALLMGFFSYDIFYTIFYKLAKNFTLEQVSEGAVLLQAFLPGLFFFSMNKMMLTIYYALHETRYTTAITIAGTVANVLLNRLLMPLYGAVGIAIATSLGAVLQTVLFLLVLQARFGFQIYYRKMASFIARFAIQLLFAIALFLVLFKLCVACVTLVFPAYADILLHHIGLWFWVGPLCLALVGILYYGRNKWGMRLYFLD